MSNTSIKNQFNKSILVNPVFMDQRDALPLQEQTMRNILLAREIKEIYRHMNYRIEDEIGLGDNYFIAEQGLFGGIEKVRFLVKCLFLKDQSVTKSDVQVFDSEFNDNRGSLNVDKGFLVTNTDFESRKVGSVKCMTQEELSKGVIYINDCLVVNIKDYEKEEIFQRYIELSANTKRNDVQIIEYLLKRIHEEKKNIQLTDQEGKALYTIFGDFGTGKTTVIKQLCYEMSKMYLAGESNKKPLYIELKDFYNHKDIISFIHNAFRKQYRGIEVLPEAVMKEITEGKFLLLLDGFDEMSAQISVESRFENLNKLSYLLNSKSICILTCRSSYFITASEYKEYIPKSIPRTGTFESRINLLKQKLKDKRIENGQSNYLGQTQVISNAIELTINPLTESQIRSYFEKCSHEFLEKCNSSVEEIYAFILGIYDLGDLITKPILLSLITDTILLKGTNYLQSEIKYGHSALYKTYTELILDRDWEKGDIRHYLTMEQRKQFAEAIAVTMLHKDALEVKYDDITSVIAEYQSILYEFEEDIENRQVQEFVASDIRVCSFLKRTDDHTFKFVHKSFMEFFVAQFIIAELLEWGDSQILSTKILNKEILFFIGGFGVYSPDVQKKIYSVWRKNVKTKNEILKRNLCCAYLLSKIEHNNFHKNTFNISDANIESISVKKISFRNVIYKNINLVNTDLVELSIQDSSQINNIIVKDSKIRKMCSEGTIFTNLQLNTVAIEDSCFNNKMISSNYLDTNFRLCDIADDLSDTFFKHCAFKECKNICFSGSENSFEDVSILNTTRLSINGGFSFFRSKFSATKISIDGHVSFDECEFKNCTFIGEDRQNAGCFTNCKFEGCSFYSFFILFDDLSYKKKIKKRVDICSSAEETKEREQLDFSHCEGIILTNSSTPFSVGDPNLLFFNVDNYRHEIDALIRKKEKQIVLWNNKKLRASEQEEERKERAKQKREQIRQEILLKNEVYGNAPIDPTIQKEIDTAINRYNREENIRIVSDEMFNEQIEKEAIAFLERYSNPEKN